MNINTTNPFRMKRGGSCETTADCVSGNVCSKWGWCQWTTIYGEEGPSQGSSATAGTLDIPSKERGLFRGFWVELGLWYPIIKGLSELNFKH